MNATSLQLEILNWQLLEEVPSASGIVKFNEGFYVIGDDSPYLFFIDHEFNLISKKLFYSFEKLIENIIPKIDKPDFEAMEMINENEMLIFGSGSKSPERDVCVKVQIADEITYQQYDIGLFYDYLRGLELMKDVELDIEGLALNDDVIYLFNRGGNFIFSFSLQHFLAYCHQEATFPKPKVYDYTLPKINGLEAGFSGATISDDKSYLIFSASVEDSPNAYDDGDILGSFLGVIGIKDGVLNEDFLIQKIPNPGFPLKVESVIVDQKLSDTITDLVLVTDNDGASSEILRVRMRLE